MKSQCHITLLLLCLTVSLASCSIRSFLTHPKSQPITSIPIHKDSFGNHYIHVSWGDNQAAAGNSLQASDSDTLSAEAKGKMILSLYSNETFISRCASFRVFPSNKFDYVYEREETKQVSYLYQGMNLTGYPVLLDIQTPAFFAINSPALFATRCSPNFKANVHGYIGLGSNDNFLMDTIGSFSIFLGDDHSSLDSALYIGDKNTLSHLYGNEKLNITVPAQKNWVLTMIDLNVALEGKKFDTNFNLTHQYNILFDLNTDFIGLPVHLYTIIKKILEGYHILCGEGSNSPYCICENPEIEDLPVFGLVVNGNSGSPETITLRPDLYFNKTNCRLLFKTVSADKYGLVKLNPSYDNSVILGAPFMRHYYVHFQQGEDGNSNLITIQKAERNSELDSTSMIIIFVVAVMSFFLILGLALAYYNLKFKEDDLEEISLEQVKSSYKPVHPLSLLKKIEVSEEPFEEEKTMSPIKLQKNSFSETRRTAANSIAEES